jgi:hypothetical protein
LIVLSALVLAYAAAAATSGTDAITACRTEHGNDAAAHIACLEAALRERHAEPAAAEKSRPTVTGATAAVPAAAAAAPPTGLGAEQARARQRKLEDAPVEQVTVRILSTSYGQSGLGVFRMEDGQVWRETEQTPERQRLDPAKQYTARIQPGKVGGYRMYVDGVRRMLKVERVQ